MLEHGAQAHTLRTWARASSPSSCIGCKPMQGFHHAMHRVFYKFLRINTTKTWRVTNGSK
jgi:hypothetical protein